MGYLCVPAFSSSLDRANRHFGNAVFLRQGSASRARSKRRTDVNDGLVGQLRKVMIFTDNVLAAFHCINRVFAFRARNQVRWIDAPLVIA